MPLGCSFVLPGAPLVSLDLRDNPVIESWSDAPSENPKWGGIPTTTGGPHSAVSFALKSNTEAAGPVVGRMTLNPSLFERLICVTSMSTDYCGLDSQVDRRSNSTFAPSGGRRVHSPSRHSAMALSRYADRERDFVRVSIIKS